MTVFLLAAVALVGMILAVMLKSYRPEFGVLCSLAVVVFLLFFTVGQLPEVLNFLDELRELGNLSQQHMRILLRSLAICIAVQIAADTCSDYGQSAIAAKVELAGKVLLLITALPLLSQILSLVRGLL